MAVHINSITPRSVCHSATKQNSRPFYVSISLISITICMPCTQLILFCICPWFLSGLLGFSSGFADCMLWLIMECSIDALLEKTIKYMKFLHTITQHIGRWSYKGKLKIAANETLAVLPVGSESGASWAVDVDANGKIGGRHCPIIVENLSQPGQMLVEILCEDRGFFLEIASNIHGLGLTILKGVMEVRNQHIWGQFVVEAVREIQRVEVLWSLAHILEFGCRS